MKTGYFSPDGAEFVITTPAGREGRVRAVSLDGRALPGAVIPFQSDGPTHRVRVELA